MIRFLHHSARFKVDKGKNYNAKNPSRRTQGVRRGQSVGSFAQWRGTD
jgi:hypothetical protein